MKFVVLPFGLSSAPYCFCKVTRPLIAKWRAESKRAVMYSQTSIIRSARDRMNPFE